MSASFRIKRVYDPPSPKDGHRILIDRLWPRGLSKASAKIDFWAKNAAPSAELRVWFDHDPAKWAEFKKRYHAELDANPAAIAELRAALGRGTVTIVFGSREAKLNNAAALVSYLQERS
ncbi:MAG: DUF488 domain-containing protein [Gemmatimonadaceae bacterium]